MITTLFLLLAADPSGLSAALQTADRLEVWDAHRRKSVTVPNSDLKRLAKRIKCDGEARRFDVKPGGAIPAAFFYEIRVLDKDGKTIGKYTLINDALYFDGKEVALSNNEFRNAIREYFEGPLPKATFLPKIANELRTDSSMAALTLSPQSSLLLVVDKVRNCVQPFQTGDPGIALVKTKELTHNKLVAPHAITATDRFVYLAGSSGIAGFRRLSSGSATFEPSEFLRDTATALYSVDGKLYAAREAEIWVYEIAGEYGRLHFQDTTLTHTLFRHPTGMASAKGQLYVVTAGGALFTFKDDKFVSVETESQEPKDSRTDQRAEGRKPCLTVDGDKLYTVGVGNGLAVWDIAHEKPTLLKRVASEAEQAKKMQSVQHVIVAGGRIWVSGYAGNLLAWFEWQDDELVYVASKDFGNVRSLVASCSRPGREQYLYAAGDNGVKIITTQPSFNPLAPPEPP